MTEDMKQKEMRLRKELAQVKALNQNAALHRPTNRNLDIAGIPMDTTPKHKDGKKARKAREAAQATARKAEAAVISPEILEKKKKEGYF